jgi:hypothetical protein
LELEAEDDDDDFDIAEEEHFAAFSREKRIPCFAHSLVNALKSSVEKAQIYTNILSAATNVVTSFTQSTSKSGMLHQLAGKRLVRPVRTRWIFAYYMMQRLIELRLHVDTIIENEGMDVGLTPNQWRQAEILCGFLKEFADQVTELEGEKYVTLNHCIPALMKLLEHCKEFEKKQGFSQIALSVAAELRRRFRYVLEPMDAKFQPIFALATLLDPAICSLLSLKEYSFLLTSAKSEALRVMRLSDSVGESEIQPTASASSASVVQATNSKYQSLFTKLAKQDEQSQSSSTNVIAPAEIELNSYLQMHLSNVNDPIAYWLKQKKSMPKLCELALDIFSVTATSAPIERVFSHAGIATYGRRNRLEEKSLNAELLMKLNQFLFD